MGAVGQIADGHAVRRGGGDTQRGRTVKKLDLSDAAIGVGWVGDERHISGGGNHRPIGGTENRDTGRRVDRGRVDLNRHRAGCRGRATVVGGDRRQSIGSGRQIVQRHRKRRAHGYAQRGGAVEVFHLRDGSIRVRSGRLQGQTGRSGQHRPRRGTEQADRGWIIAPATGRLHDDASGHGRVRRAVERIGSRRVKGERESLVQG